jgi:hypothetical protein
MTEVRRAIILTGFIGTLLTEYKEDEITPSIRTLIDACTKFTDKRSGVELVMVRGKFGGRIMTPRVTDKKRHEQFLETMKIANTIWNSALERYAKHSLKIDAISTVVALYEFLPEVLHKHARIRKEQIDAYATEGNDGDEVNKTAGAVFGGYLTELLAAEMGIKVNGRLRALKHKVERNLGEVA